MRDYTKEPWQIYTYSHQHWSIETAWKDGNIPKQIAGIRPGESSAALHILPIEEQEANARRIVACVNACTGLATEQLEAMGNGGVQALVEAVAEECALIAEAHAGITLYGRSAPDRARRIATVIRERFDCQRQAALAPFAGDTEGVE